MTQLQATNVGCGPVAVGNLLADPVICHLNHSVASRMPAAEKLDRSSFFNGKCHYATAPGLNRIADIMRAFAVTSTKIS